MMWYLWRNINVLFSQCYHNKLPQTWQLFQLPVCSLTPTSASCSWSSPLCISVSFSISYKDSFIRFITQLQYHCDLISTLNLITSPNTLFQNKITCRDSEWTQIVGRGYYATHCNQLFQCRYLQHYHQGRLSICNTALVQHRLQVLVLLVKALVQHPEAICGEWQQVF